MNRRNTMLALLAAAQLVLILILYWPGQTVHTAEIEILDVDPSSIASFSISDSYGSNLTIENRDGNWFVDPPEDYSADTGRVKSALKKIAHLSSTRLVSSTMGSQARLSVSPEKFNRRIQLVGRDGRKYLIYLGTAMGRGVHARNGDSSDVVFLPDLSFWEFGTSPRSWWKTSLVDVDPGALREVELSNSHGTVHLERSRDGNWTEETGVPLDQARVGSFLDGIKGIRILEYISSNSGEKIGEPVAVLRLVPADGDEIIIEVGPALGNKSDKTDKVGSADHLVKISTDKHLVKVSDADSAGIIKTGSDALSLHGNQVISQ